MFEAAELGRHVARKSYKARVPALRTELLNAQFALADSGRPVLLIVEGVDNTCKGEVINTLNEWLDTRELEVHAFGKKTDEESERPRFWRYWRCLPPAGKIAIFSSSWYTGTLYQRTFGQISKAHFDDHLRRIAFLERMLAQDGMLVLKFWLHMSHAHQEKKFEALSKKPSSRSIPSTLDKKLHKHYHKHLLAAERAIRLTDQALSPWIIVEAEDARYRNLTVTQTLLEALSKTGVKAPPSVAVPPVPEIRLMEPDEGHASVLSRVDLSVSLDKQKYKDKLVRRQRRLTELSWQAYHAGITTTLVFEGWDAAGKGGAIRRIMQAVDARISRVISIAAPTDEEKAHHYLWRFWRHLPRAGRMIIYDRSWYGRVLVERVEGYATESEWRRAYLEINDFEEQLTNHGMVLQKFWLHIDPDEQLRRFQEREKIPYKQHKITEEDWRNREKWTEYEAAVDEMVVRTSTAHSPWHLIPGNDKKWARVKVLELLCEALERAVSKQRSDH